MNHYRYLRIQNYRGIKELEIAEIGRINILCGKNNSGKSTILNSILEKHAEYGIILKEIEVENIFESIDEEYYHWDYEGDERILLPFVVDDFEFGAVYDAIKEKKVLENYILTNELLLSNDYFGFKNKLIKAALNQGVDLKGIRDWSYDHEFQGPDYKDDLFKAFYKRIVAFNGKPILIDAKRSLDPYILLSEFKNKKNLLKFLFYLKNSHNDHEKKSLSNLKKVFKEITSGFQFLIVSDQEFKLTLNFVNSNGERHSADQCGLGLRDLLQILSNIIFARENHIFLIEEPENHLHPNIQRKLLDYISRNTDNQFFITTHSNVFLDTKFIDRIFHVKYHDNRIDIEEMNSKANLLNDLGYSISDNLIADLIILVEGPSDKMIVEEFFIKYGIYAKYNLKIWALGGSIMDRHDLSIFSNTYQVMALIDNDPEENREIFESKCQKLDIEIFKLEKYSIENYFTIQSLKEVFGNRITVSDDFIIKDNIKISKQKIGDFNPKRSDNPRKIAKAMTLEDIKNTDFEKFFEVVQEKLNNIA